MQDMLKFLWNSFLDSKLNLFVVYGSVFGTELVKLEKQLWKTPEIDFAPYFNLLFSLSEMIFPTLDLFCRPSHFRDFLKPLALPLFSASFVSRRFFSFYQIPFSAKGLAETAVLILKVSYFLQQKLIYLKSIYS